MHPQQVIFLTTIILGTTGLVLLLRPGWGGLRLLGAALSAIAFGAVLAQAPMIRPIQEGVVFYLLAALTVGAALAAVSLVHPLYCAVCFGLTLVGVSALMAYGGAQFLAAGTLIVYVGAILVVLLFVLMLAHPRGRATYDWNRWEVFVSAGTAVVFLAMLSLLITRSLAGPEQLAAQAEDQRQQTGADQPATATVPPPPEENFLPPKAGQGVLASEHVARIGQHLFGGHWLAVQAAGVLLLAALVGAAVIIGRLHGPLEGPQQPGGHSPAPIAAGQAPRTESQRNS
ncbi:MAG TPA: NADH-quinone oxidoreductase subunit J [Thermoguttaceae bacterium]|nr:NADH-quinone oxidoreductase subunit J [Thermoguttaceae bacterium]